MSCETQKEGGLKLFHSTVVLAIAFLLLGTHVANNLEQAMRRSESYLPNLNSHIKIQNVTVIEVCRILTAIDISKLTGHYGISNKHLQDSVDMTSHLHLHCNPRY